MSRLCHQHGPGIVYWLDVMPNTFLFFSTVLDRGKLDTACALTSLKLSAKVIKLSAKVRSCQVICLSKQPILHIQRAIDDLTISHSTCSESFRHIVTPRKRCCKRRLSVDIFYAPPLWGSILCLSVTQCFAAFWCWNGLTVCLFSLTAPEECELGPE